MRFIPGLNSPLDSNAGGKATYQEIIPAVYSNYILENKKIEAEIGLRLEYVRINYIVGESHPVYKTDGYDYTQPFPNVRLAYKFDDKNRVSLFFNRRVDRPNEVDIRIFPKYDDAEIIKVGNPALRPQFTNSLELGYKSSFKKGYFYSAIYSKISQGIITRVASTVNDSPLIYSIFQNANRGYNTGIEVLLSHDPTKWFSYNVNLNLYQNIIEAFYVENLYPVTNSFLVDRQELISGNMKLNAFFHLPKNLEVQTSVTYLAPDIIPQGKIEQRFSIDCGLKIRFQKGLGEAFLNATDIANTMVIRKSIQGTDFSYTSADYVETQVVRIGYSYKF